MDNPPQIKISQSEITKLLLERGLTIESVIDAVAQLNGLLGVGFISLGNHLKDYCYNKSKKQIYDNRDFG